MSVKANEALNINPIDDEMIKKSKRTKIILIVFIVILIAALGGLVFFGYNILSEAMSTNQVTFKPVTDMNDGKVVDTGAPKTVEYKKTTIPDLTALFGLTASEVETRLGSSFKLTKTDVVSDPSNPKVVQLATFAYTPELIAGNESDISKALMPGLSVYTSLDANGKVIDVYFACDMRLLDYPETSFMDLLATDWVVRTSLQSAGVTPRDPAYLQPSFEETIVYDNVNSVNRKVIKQSQIFSGRTTSEKIPTVWTLTVTYDFGSGVSSADDYKNAIRTIHLKLV